MSHHDLSNSVSALLDAGARLVSTVPVHEESGGEIVWDGEVHVFELDGHPDADRCYAWSHPTDDGKERIVTVLGVPPIDSPEAAVRAAIVQEWRERQGED